MSKSSAVNQAYINGDAFKFLPECNLKAKINWTVANPIFRGSKPRYLKESLSIDEFIAYREIGGDPSLIKATKEYFLRQGVECYDKNIVIGNGIVSIFGSLCSILRVKEANQKILLSAPIYGYFYQYCRRNEIKTDFVNYGADEKWETYLYNLDKKLRENPDIRIFLINYPNNPTGKVMNKEMLDGLSKVLQKYQDVLIVSDEVLIDLIFDLSNKSHSPASIPGLKSRTIILNSPAKSRPLAAINLAFGYLPDHVAELYYLEQIQELPSTGTQKITAQAIENTQENADYLAADIEQYKKNIVHLQQRIQVINEKLNQHFGESDKAYIKMCTKDLQGGNTCLVDFSALKDKSLLNGQKFRTGLDVARFLLDETKIGVVPGECFFIPADEMVIRVPLSVNQAEITIGFDLISGALINNFVNKNTPTNTPSPQDSKQLAIDGKIISKL